MSVHINVEIHTCNSAHKKRDDLQDAIAAIKTIDIGLPIEFINFRD